METKDVENETEEKLLNQFYSNAANYWAKVPATVDGMLGGFGFISQTDIEGSGIFLRALFKLNSPPNKEYALDCGAGIGRISKHLLTKYFKKVDLVEQNAEFLNTAKTYLADRANKLGHLYPIGLQDFSPEARKYDVIWCQWVLGHLQDDDFVKFLANCREGLKENGMIIVKENTTSSNKMDIDVQDSSVTRPFKELQRLFLLAGLIIVKEQQQHRLPRGLYPVHMFALRAKGVEKTHPSNLQ